MNFDKAQAVAVLNSIYVDNKPIAIDQQKLSSALDELFAKQEGKTVKGVDFHVYGGADDHNSDLDEKVIAIYLISGIVDDDGMFHEDDGHPSLRVPLAAI